jgi:hypothetical protein
MKIHVFKIYNGHEIWTLKQKIIRKIKTAKMEFIVHTTGHSLLDQRSNEDISE